MIQHPYSIRMSTEMMAELKRWANSERRSLHAQILAVLDGALAERRRGFPELASGGNDIAILPTPPIQPECRGANER